MMAKSKARLVESEDAEGAEDGGIATAEMNALEAAFLKAIGFDLGVSEREYELYARTLQMVSKHAFS